MGCHVKNSGWEPDREPSLGRQGRRWFRGLAEQRLRPFLRQYGNEELLQRVVDWYLARVASYAVWRPTDAYLGPRYAWGEWSIPKGALEEDVEIAVYQCLQDAAADRDTERFATLDDWIAAEGRGELEATGITEPPARHLIEGRMALHFYIEARARMLKARPRTCPDCGREFQPTTTKARRCDDCCTSRREKREGRPLPRRQARGDR